MIWKTIFNIANQSFHGISNNVINNHYGSFGTVNVDNVGTIFLAAQDWPALKKTSLEISWRTLR